MLTYNEWGNYVLFIQDPPGTTLAGSLRQMQKENNMATDKEIIFSDEMMKQLMQGTELVFQSQYYDLFFNAYHNGDISKEILAFGLQTGELKLSEYIKIISYENKNKAS